jgi:putative GTP pyrophosphokinase
VAGQRTSCYPTLSDRELLEKYVSNDGEIGLWQMLRGLTVINTVVPDRGSTILQFRTDGELVLHRVFIGKVPADVYFELEKNNSEDDIVLVRADTFAEIRSSYRNYFSDTNEFFEIRTRMLRFIGKARRRAWQRKREIQYSEQESQ